MIIYKATNKVNHKCYIGQTISTLHKRKISHKSEVKINRNNSKFHNAVRKHGWESFEWSILYECDSKKELDIKEIHYIKELSTIKHGYNIRDGGSLGSYNKKDSIETKNKKSDARKGNLNPMYGKKHTDTEKELMSINRKGKCLGNDNPASKQSGTYLVTFPDGHQETIKNLRGFCRDNNISSHSEFYKMCNGKRKIPFKGYWAKRLIHSHQKLCEMNES